MFQRLAQNRPEHDHDRDALDGAAESLLERVDERLPVETGNQSEQHDRHEQREEHVPLEAGDQQEEQGDHGDQAADGDECALGNHRDRRRFG